MQYDNLMGAIVVKSTNFGNSIDPGRKLVDMATASLVEVELPEYERNGLGKALLKVVRYYFEDLDAYGVEGMSIGADTSRGFMIYEDMKPVVAGKTHRDAMASAPPGLVKALIHRGLPIELVTLGVLRSSEFKSVDKLISFIEMYHQRASWMESHPFDVHLANVESETGDVAVFDWPSIAADGGR